MQECTEYKNWIVSRNKNSNALLYDHPLDEVIFERWYYSSLLRPYVKGYMLYPTQKLEDGRVISAKSRRFNSWNDAKNYFEHQYQQKDFFLFDIFKSGYGLVDPATFERINGAYIAVRYAELEK